MAVSFVFEVTGYFGTLSLHGVISVMDTPFVHGMPT
jgi:hypothetical protein